MKTFILILLLASSFSFPLFADDEAHEYGRTEMHESGEYHHRSEHRRYNSAQPSKSLEKSKRLTSEYDSHPGTEHGKPKVQKTPTK